MTLQQFLLILWARRRLAVLTFLTTVSAALIVSLLLPKQYSATADIVVDVKSPDPIAGVLLPGLMAPGYMATQVDIINSDRVAQRVVSLLKIDQSADRKEQWKKQTGGAGDFVAWVAEGLQNKLLVKPSRESNVVSISFTSADPQFAALAANAFAKAYIETNIELRVEPARQYAAWFDEQMRLHRERLEAAQRALSAYQQKTGIVATDERLDYETQKLNELSVQLTQVEAQSTDAVSKQKFGGSDTLPEVIQNPLINQLKTDVARGESKLKELSGNLGVNHPQYQRALAELEELKNRLRQETAKIAGSINTATRVSQAKESDLQAAIEAQKRKVLELRQQRDEISLLSREVDTAQRAFDAVGQRMTQSKLESQSVQTNISILTPAAEPTAPASPKVFRNVLISAFLGSLLAVGLALVMELGQRRVRSTDDLILVLDLPVLVQLDSALPLIEQKNWRFWRTRLLARSPLNERSSVAET